MADTLRKSETGDVAPVVRDTTDLHQPHGFTRIFGALRESPYYRTFWFGNQSSLLFNQMMAVAIGYITFTLTGSAGIVGLVSLAQGLPMLFFSPVGGVIADRYAKRDLLIAVQVTLCLNAVVVGILVSLGLIQWWHLLAVGFVQGMAFSVNMPARQSWIPSLVKASELPNAIALNNAGLNAARVIGPALAGVLIAIPGFGANGVFYLSVPAALWVLYSLFQIPIRGFATATKRSSFWTEFTAGLRYIWNHQTLAPLFTLAAVTLLLGTSYQSLLPAYALGVFNVGSEGQGLMSTFVGLGALVGSLSMAYFSRSRRKRLIQSIAGTVLGLSLLCFGVASGLKLFALALAVLFVVGLATDFYSTINNTLILLNTEPALYGRVMSVYMMTWSLSPLAAAPLGTAIDTIGGATTMIVIGAVLAVFVLGMTRFHPGFRKLS
jgi:MFS family permease